MYYASKRTTTVDHISFFLFLCTMSGFTRFFPRDGVFSIKVRSGPNSISIGFSYFVRVHVVRHRTGCFHRGRHVATGQVTLRRPTNGVCEAFHGYQDFRVLRQGQYGSYFFGFVRVSSTSRTAMVANLYRFFINRVGRGFSNFLCSLVEVAK